MVCSLATSVTGCPRRLGLLLSWLERTPDKGEVGSSNLPRPTNCHGMWPICRWCHSSAGRAPALHAGGQRFDPAWLHHSSTNRLKYRKSTRLNSSHVIISYAVF